MRQVLPPHTEAVRVQDRIHEAPARLVAMLLACMWLLIVLATLPWRCLADGAELSAVQQAITANGLGWVATDYGHEFPLGALPEEEPAPDTLVDPLLAAPDLADLPSSLDWRNYGGNWVSPVKNQGGCGSCWAFAAVGALESKIAIANGTAGTFLDLSEQILVSCATSNLGCSGGYMGVTATFMRDEGTWYESCYPYAATNGNCANACSAWPSNHYRIDTYYYVSRNVDALKQALQDGPVQVSFYVYTDFNYYGGGVYEQSWGDYRGGHAVLAVGYVNTPGQYGGGYFIVKNSWGSGWGESGYFRIGYSQMDSPIYFGRNAYRYVYAGSEPTATPTATRTSTPTQTPTVTATATQTATPTATATQTTIIEDTPTPTATQSPTATTSATPTATQTEVGDDTPTPTPTVTTTATATETEVIADTPTPTMTPTVTPAGPAAPDAYEPDDTFAESSYLAVDQLQTHSIAPSGDVDWVTFALGDTCDVVIELSGDAGGDTEMWLYDSAEDQIAYSDDDGTDLYSRIAMDDLTPGTYAVRVATHWSWPDMTIANYQIALTADCGGGDMRRALTSDWNLVSLPLVPARGAPVEVLESVDGHYQLAMAYGHDGQSKLWYGPDLPPEDQTLTHIDHTVAFWLLMNDAAVLTIKGDAPGSTEQALSAGWNLVTYPCTETQPVAAALASIDGSYSTVYGFKGHWQRYSTTVPAWANDLQTLEPGYAYYVAATQPCTLTIQN